MYATENTTWSYPAFLVSSLPASFTKLTHLENMYMKQVRVMGGTLPPLWRLPRLSQLSLGVGAGVVGGLPDNWSKTASLQTLVLGLEPGFTGVAACC